MKEREIGPSRLTREPDNLTLRSEGISMPEEGRSEVNPTPESQKPKAEGYSREQTDKIKAWEQKSGIPWDKTPLDLRSAWLAGGETRQEQPQEQMREGPPDAPAGGEPPPEGDEDEGELATREAIRAEILRNKKLLMEPDYREDYFNRLFSTTYAYPDKAFAEIFSPYYGHGRQYDNFMNLIQGASVGLFPGELEGDPDFTPEVRKRIQGELQDDFLRYQKEKQVLGAIHDASRVLFYPSVDTKSYLEAIQQFDSKGGDVAFRSPGVNQMMNIIENVLRETMAKYDGFLPPEAISGKVEMEERRGPEGKVTKLVKKVTAGDVEIEVKKRYREWVEKGLIVARNEKGKALITSELRTPKDWEIERTFSVARGMMLIDMRLVSIMAESKQPEGTAQYSSQFLQDILQGWSGFQHLIGKYGLTRKDMAVLLYKDENIKKMLGLGIWEPKDLEKTFKKYKKDFRSVLEDAENPDELYYIMRENPLRGGDVFTHISWRLNPDLKKGKEEAVESMVKDFIDKGRAKMKRRWNARGGVPNSSEYETFIKDTDRITQEATRGKKEKEIAKIREKIKRRRDKEWKHAHGVAPTTADFEKYIGEYENWIGTGIRFEKLRGDMALTGDKEEKREKREKAIEEGKKILERMSKLQGYRLYSLSSHVRERIKSSGVLSTYTPEQIDLALADLSSAEAALLKDRENILNSGKKTFNNIFLSRYYDVIPKEESRRAIARTLAKEIMADFRNSPEKYYDEFIYKREYRHGFVLWTGDAPLDEFNFTRLAPTGGFVRRARDNTHEAAASGKVLELLSKLKHIHEMDKIVEGLAAIHDEIALYDSDKADMAIAELSQGLVKFYSERTRTKLPIWGPLERAFGKDISFAKIVHGKGAMAWSSTEAAVFIDQLRNLNYITEEQEKLLKEKVAVSTLDFLADSGSFLTQLLLLWFVGYLAEKIIKER